ncbi:MAG: nucleoside deaminase [Pigmentiphaga sp.]|nr:nucleoside deaminase [Pigmentiphaga sp.]
MNDANRFLDRAVELARQNVEAGGRPFGALVVRDGEVIATAVNEIHLSHDLTDHAKLLAIRAAARDHGPQVLKGSAVYASGHPCPMCLAAMRLAGVNAVTYAYSNQDAAPFGLSTADLYNELKLPFAEQSMEIRHRPLDGSPRPDLYEQWAKAQSDPE